MTKAIDWLRAISSETGPARCRDASWVSVSVGLVVTVLTQGSLDPLDLTIAFLSAVYYAPVCIPAIAVVAIPLGIGGGHIGLEIARASGRQDSRPWVWFGAAVGGVAGYVLGSPVAFAIGHVYVGRFRPVQGEILRLRLRMP
jgi:hypothetical protein